jgi:hypothetical protein
LLHCLLLSLFHLRCHIFFGDYVLLVKAMEEEHSPTIDIMGDASMVPLSEASTASSSSNASSGAAANDVAKTKADDVVDPRELAWSFDFGASSVTVGRIQQLESLRYFAEGSAPKLGEETILGPNDNEVVVFEEYFAAGLRMPLHPALTKKFAQVSGAAASTNPECYCPAV